MEKQVVYVVTAVFQDWSELGSDYLAGIFAKEEDAFSFCVSENQRCDNAREKELVTGEYSADEEFRYLFEYKGVEVK